LSLFIINVIYIKLMLFNNIFLIFIKYVISVNFNNLLIFKLYAIEIHADYNLIKTYILINLYLNSIFFSIVNKFLRHYYSKKNLSLFL